MIAVLSAVAALGVVTSDIADVGVFAVVAADAVVAVVAVGVASVVGVATDTVVVAALLPAIHVAAGIAAAALVDVAWVAVVDVAAAACFDFGAVAATVAVAAVVPAFLDCVSADVAFVYCSAVNWMQLGVMVILGGAKVAVMVIAGAGGSPKVAYYLCTYTGVDWCYKSVATSTYLIHHESCQNFSRCAP